MAPVVTGEDLAKGRAAAADIRASRPSAELDVMALDLASFASIRSFAAEFSRRYSQLDVLIANAGVSTRRRQLSADGYELNFAVNHLGHQLLTGLLLPRLKAAGQARIVVISSSLHKNAKIDFSDLQGEKTWSMTSS